MASANQWGSNATTLATTQIEPRHQNKVTQTETKTGEKEKEKFRTTTCWPSMEVLVSITILTAPEETVDEPYDETACMHENDHRQERKGQ